MESADRLLRRVGSVLLWVGALLLAAFGIYFSFANYPWLSIGVLVLIVILLTYSEQRRRARQKARDVARHHARAQSGSAS